MARIKYTIDGTDFQDYGVYVSASSGVIDGLKMKDPLVMDWEDYHGQAVDLSAPRYNPRQITLSCWMKADNMLAFATQVNEFLALFDKAGLRRLIIGIDADKPLIYQVYRSGDMAVDKKWNAAKMIGTFTITLMEPQPVKKILSYTRTSDTDKTLSITFASEYNILISWGDGTETDNQAEGTVTHDYATNGTFYIVIAGNIGDITSFTTTGTTIWSRL